MVDNGEKALFGVFIFLCVCMETAWLVLGCTLLNTLAKHIKMDHKEDKNQRQMVSG